MIHAGEYFQFRDLEKILNADVVKKARARGTSPPWLKAFAGQLEDPEYVTLTLAERGFLHDLRLLALRRGNKLLNDEHYLRVQLRLTPRTLTGPKVDRLCALGFLEPYNHATNIAANQLVLSLPDLESGEIHSAVEVEGELEGPPYPPEQGGVEPAARQTSRPRARAQALPTALNGSGHGVAYIRSLIDNGVISQMFELDEELTHAVVTSKERDTLRARIRARFTQAEGHRLPDDELEHQLVELGAGEDELMGLLELAADLRSAQAVDALVGSRAGAQDPPPKVGE